MAAWPPLRLDADLETHGGRHDGAARRAGRSDDGQLNCKHGIAGEEGEQAIVHHGLGARAAFFAGLEDQVHGTVKVGFCASSVAAPSSMVWPSWPQACILPGMQLA
jgi:hypothetical protein